MMFFGSKPTAVTLVRAWCSPFGDDGPAGEFLALVDQLLALMPPASLEGSLNAGYGSPLSSLRRALGKLSPEQVESLSLQDEAGETVFQVEAQADARPDQSPVFGFLVVLPPAAAAVQDRVLATLSAVRMHYGYARVLGPGFSPLTEARVKRSLLGKVTFAPPLPRSDWLVPEEDVRAGAVRGLYPTNVLSAVALARLSGSGMQLPSSVPGVGGTLWRPSAREQAEIVRLNPTFRDYLHFGNS
jgi:hypothetical protein